MVVVSFVQDLYEVTPYFAYLHRWDHNSFSRFLSYPLPQEQFLAYTVGLPVNVDSIFSVQDCLLKAIDKAKVNNEPTDYLVNLKNEVDFLKYQILR